MRLEYNCITLRAGIHDLADKGGLISLWKTYIDLRKQLSLGEVNKSPVHNGTIVILITKVYIPIVKVIFLC